MVIKQDKTPNQNSLWNYYKDGVTQSFTKKYRECKLQTKLEYVDGWTRKDERLWFRYGHLIHHLLELGYSTGVNLEDEDSVYQIARAFAMQNFWFADTVPDEVQEENQLLILLAKHLIPRYFKLNILDRKATKTIEVEKELRWEVCDSFIRGKLDRIYYDVDGSLVIMDHKTTSRVLKESEFYDEQKFDTQTYLYMLLAQVAYGSLPVRMEYNFIRTPALKYNRSKKISNLEFVERINKEFDYAPGEFLMRISIKLTGDELFYWITNQLVPLMEEIRDWWDKGCPPFPYNEQSLRTKYNTKCELYDLIVNQFTRPFYQRKEAFPEYSSNGYSDA